MQGLPGACPLCDGKIVVTQFRCRQCETTFEGRFRPTVTRFARLSDEQLAFVETFIRHEGKLNRVGDELGLSYPTVRNRLREIIRALGYQPEETEAPLAVDEALRRKVLDDLEAGRISPDEALRLLEGEGGEA